MKLKSELMIYKKKSKKSIIKYSPRLNNIIKKEILLNKSLIIKLNSPVIKKDLNNMKRAMKSIKLAKLNT